MSCWKSDNKPLLSVFGVQLVFKPSYERKDPSKFGSWKMFNIDKYMKKSVRFFRGWEKVVVLTVRQCFLSSHTHSKLTKNSKVLVLVVFSKSCAKFVAVMSFHHHVLLESDNKTLLSVFGVQLVFKPSYERKRTLQSLAHEKFEILRST